MARASTVARASRRCHLCLINVHSGSHISSKRRKLSRRQPIVILVGLLCRGKEALRLRSMASATQGPSTPHKNLTSRTATAVTFHLVCLILPRCRAAALTPRIRYRHAPAPTRRFNSLLCHLVPAHSLSHKCQRDNTRLSSSRLSQNKLRCWTARNTSDVGQRERKCCRGGKGMEMSVERTRTAWSCK